MPTIPPLSSLRSFEAVARLGSVTLAAQELHVTHSAISQQLKSLEDMLGVGLFIRDGRTLQVSEDGRLYALQVRETLLALAESTRQIKAQPRTPELVVAVMPSFGHSWLLPRIERFLERHPGTSIRLHASLTLSNLAQETIDLAVRMGRGDWPGLEKRLMFHDVLVPVAAPGFRDGNLPRTPQEIVNSPIIFTMDPWQPWCQAAGLDAVVPRCGLSSNDSNLVLEAVRLRHGIALLRRSLVHEAIRRGELVQLSEFVAPYNYPYWLVLPERERPGVKRDLFATWLFEEVELYLREVG